MFTVKLVLDIKGNFLGCMLFEMPPTVHPNVQSLTIILLSSTCILKYTQFLSLTNAFLVYLIISLTETNTSQSASTDREWSPGQSMPSLSVNVPLWWSSTHLILRYDKKSQVRQSH